MNEEKIKIIIKTVVVIMIELLVVHLLESYIHSNNPPVVKKDEVKPIEKEAIFEKYCIEEDIEFNDKTNIYFFWREGCKNCKAEFVYLNKFYKENNEKYNIFAFEVLNNSDNYELMKKFGKALDKEITGVPFIIVGDKEMVGYIDNEKHNNRLNNLLKSGLAKDIDIYRDKIRE